MRRLVKIAFGCRQHLFLLLLTVMAMCCLTFASQLEIFTLGIMTKKGPDVFELFAPLDQGKLQKNSVLTQQLIAERWNDIDLDRKGYISYEDAIGYLQHYRKNDLIEKGVSLLERYIPIRDNLATLALFLLFVALFKAITLFYHRFVTRIVAIRMSADLRQAYFEHIQTLSLDFYQQHNSGALSSRVVSDAVLIAEAINACLINYFEAPFRIVTTLLLCFLTSWQLSLIVFLGLPLIVFPIIFLAKRVKRISKQVQKNQEVFSSVLIDFLAGIQTIKIFAMEEFSLKKYREQNNKMAALEQKSARYDVSSRPILHTIAMFFLATTLLYGLYILHLSVAEVLIYCGFLYIFYEPIKKFAEENSHIQRGIAAAERMFDVMALKPQINDHEDATPFDFFQHSIEFDNVWFRYGEEWVLQGLSFTINKGETVAIVGPTGAGKSTIVQLLVRLYEVQKGEIRIDGKPLSAYTQRSLCQQMAFVPQKPFLFLDTVAENISFGSSFSRQEIAEAAKKAHAEEFIHTLPQQYDTLLAEAGRNLSGGQQQRLAIARALVKKAPILIMDEATSSLDPLSENAIKSAIANLHGTVTQIIIAHRFSTIENADKIIFLEKGKKSGEGSRQELMLSCPSFAKMWGC